MTAAGIIMEGMGCTRVGVKVVVDGTMGWPHRLLHSRPRCCEKRCVRAGTKGNCPQNTWSAKLFSAQNHFF